MRAPRSSRRLCKRHPLSSLAAADHFRRERARSRLGSPR
jgi:hypothetical protein